MRGHQHVFMLRVAVMLIQRGGRHQVARLEAVLADLTTRPPAADEHPRLRQAQIDAVTGQRDALLAQLAE
ncbi:MAG TPA: hypothetical protein VM142_01785 [Acidimicrobiales bacterium]|nr:hypothetical protein [Acidimicrobiales bacterium]